MKCSLSFRIGLALLLLISLAGCNKKTEKLAGNKTPVTNEIVLLEDLLDESNDIVINNEEPRKPLPYSVGNVMAISNQTEYKPLVNWIYGLSERIAADGERLSIRDGELVDSLGNATGELPYVIYSDDLRILIDGVSAGEPHYMLYNNGGELLYESDGFLPPDNEGEYFLLVSLAWSNNDTDIYLAYSGYQYWFKIIMG